MTDVIATYLVRILMAAMVCSILKCIPGQKGSAARMVQMVCTIFLLFTILSPLKTFSAQQLHIWSEEIARSGQEAVDTGYTYYSSQLRQSIKDEIESYIWDKANALQAQLQVDVTLSDDEFPTPVTVRLSGNVSPFAKSQLQQILENELGISKENQQWM